MASPFRIFRRHQKKLLATLGIMAIVAFCIPTGFLGWIGSHGAPEARPVVSTAKYGDLTGRELESLQDQRLIARRFLQEVHRAVYLAKAERNRTGGPEDQVELSAHAAEWALNMIGGTTKEDLVGTWLCAQRAAELGFVVSKEAIGDFIWKVTEDQLTNPQVAQIINDVAGSEQRLFRALGHELMALRVRLMFSVSLDGTTPAQRWDYYTRLARRATIEAIPLAVADFVEEVEDPGDAVLREFFQEYKGNLPAPNSPVPGFRKPREIAVRFFKADIEKFAAAVPDEEVQQYYEENREYLDLLFSATTEGPTLTLEEEDVGVEVEEELQQGSVEEDAAEEESGIEEEAQGNVTEPAEDETEEDDTANEAAGNDEAAESSEDPAGQPDSTTAEDESADERPIEGPDVPPDQSDGSADELDPGEASSGAAASRFRLTSFFEAGAVEGEGEGEADAAEPTAVVPETPEQPETEGQEPPAEPVGPALGPALPGGQTEPTEEARPDGEAEPADLPEPADEVEPTADAEAPDAGSTEPPVEPSEAVPVADEATEPADPLAGPLGDEIRRELARQQIARAFPPIQSAIEEYGDRETQYQADRLDNPSARPPKEPDYQALARENDPTGEGALTTDVTPLMSVWDFRKQKAGIGRSQIIDGQGSTSFADYAFRESWGPYLPAESLEVGSDYRMLYRYLFWKVEESEEREVKFEGPGVREEVLRQWKAVEARELALEAAEDLAEEARELDLPLHSTFLRQLDLVVLTPPPFSWMTRGNVPQGMARAQPRRSVIEEIELAGDDFMRAVFDLKKGEIGVTMNLPKTVAYVVRVADFNKTDELLQSEFEVDSYYGYADVASADQKHLVQAWQKELENAAGLEWTQQEPQAASGQ